jgi:hypothetical protein
LKNAITWTARYGPGVANYTGDCKTKLGNECKLGEALAEHCGTFANLALEALAQDAKLLKLEPTEFDSVEHKHQPNKKRVGADGFHEPSEGRWDANKGAVTALAKLSFK